LSVSRIRHGACVVVCLRGGLLARQQPGSEPPVDRGGGDAELACGLLDREQIAVGVRRWRGADPVLLAQELHAWVGEWQAGAGASALLVEDRGDLAVIAVPGEPADQIDCVLWGARALNAAVHERHRELGASAALPTDLDLLGASRRVGDGHHDL